MIGLTLWVLMFTYAGLLIAAGVKNKTWGKRFKWWGILLTPLALWLWDLPVIYYQHEQACKAEGGLRVLIAPEKTDRVQLDGKSYGSDIYPEGLLKDLYPSLQLVEARDFKGSGSDRYFAYSVDPSSGDGDRRRYRIIKTPLAQPTSNLYVFTRSYEPYAYGEKEQTGLTRDGKLYAKWTNFKSIWNSAGLLQHGWQCYTESNPRNELTKLILK